MSVQFGIWIVALVSSLASQDFQVCILLWEMPSCCAKPTCLLCPSAPQNFCFAQCPLFGQKWAVSCLSSIAFRVEPGKGFRPWLNRTRLPLTLGRRPEFQFQFHILSSRLSHWRSSMLPSLFFSAQEPGSHRPSWPAQARGLGQRLLQVSDIHSPLL